MPEYTVIFNQSVLNLAKIEELIYQRDCTKSLAEKSFEALQSMADKLIKIESELNL